MQCSPFQINAAVTIRNEFNKQYMINETTASHADYEKAIGNLIRQLIMQHPVSLKVIKTQKMFSFVLMNIILQPLDELIIIKNYNHKKISREIDIGFTCLLINIFSASDIMTILFLIRETYCSCKNNNQYFKQTLGTFVWMLKVT